ncbi:S53 family peptidase [Paraburkholderia sp. HD33-4]|uniref:S53 family peptidase n=1 Tax=Paraburkholderia sp. HD33-4 TaxID=2883242 RepID=UPI001F2C99E6|nr:S53 family peptidase [Paraburkholderia sp. HD33-4]
MASSSAYLPIMGSEHPHPAAHTKLKPTDSKQELTVTLLLRRRRTAPDAANANALAQRDAFAIHHGADPDELEAVKAFATDAGLSVVEADAARRSVIVHGTVAAVNKAFNVQLNDYQYQRGEYRSHDGAVSVPTSIANYVEAVVGLTDRKVHATHFSTASAARKRASMDPPNTKPLTPAQIATLYNFPAGDGAGQTIGLYEMETSDGPAGYAPSDIAATMAALGNLPVPRIVDVAVDGTQNSGQSDGETGLDITVAGAIAPGATIAVYFAGAQPQNMIHALQMMIHPNAGEPTPSIVSISYGWGPDDLGEPGFSDSEWTQISMLFEDANTNKISVLVSSGDSGAQVASRTQAQTSYPASDPWVTACGGTTIGNVNGGTFEEWVWNDVGAAGPGATGGGVSARFAVPSFQSEVTLPKRVGTGQAGRGVPDIAGNASENSGYLQVINGQPAQPVGGTSAVAPLYAGLMARINQNNGFPAGYLNTLLYSVQASTFHVVSGAPGPVNNSFGNVKGYPVSPVWDACTGLGSVDGQALQAALAARGAGQ